MHTRDAEADTATVLKDAAQSGVAGVLHCFSSGRGLAESGLGLGFYISIAGIVTFKNAEELRATVRDMPLDRLLVETDAPYLAPVPHRGRPNEPALLVHTARESGRAEGRGAAGAGARDHGQFLPPFRKGRAAGGPRLMRVTILGCGGSAGVPMVGRSAAIGAPATRPIRATGAARSRSWSRRTIR